MNIESKNMHFSGGEIEIKYAEIRLGILLTGIMMVIMILYEILRIL